MSAGQIWQRRDGLVWVEVQGPAVEPSGWRLMIPLVDLDDAPDAPPLVVTIDRHRARVHLLDQQLAEFKTRDQTVERLERMARR